MSSEDDRNVVQDAIRAVREALDPVVRGAGDPGIRREILLALGVNPPADGGELELPETSLARIDEYRDQGADEADLQAFVSVIADITQVLQALIDFIRAAVESDGDAEVVVDEAVGTALQALTVGYLRARVPALYISASALQLVEEQGVRYGGITQLLFRTGEYFEELFGSAAELDTDEDAKRVSDVALFVPGVLLSALLDAEFVYGYDAGLLSDSPVADIVSNRTLTLKFTGKAKSSEGHEVKGGLVLSTALLPRDHGGPGLVGRIQADLSLEVAITSNLSLKIDFPVPASGLVFYAGEGSPGFPSSTDDPKLKLSLIYKSKPTSEIIWGDAGGVHLRIGSSKLEGSVGPNDQDFKFEIKDSAFVLATESADGFLRTMLDQVTSDGTLETEFDFNFGYKKGKWFVGGGMGLMMSLPLHESFLFLKLNTLTLGMAVGETAGDEAGVKVEASLSFGLDIEGVLTAAVERLGLAGYVAFESGEVELRFKPPNGVGLAVRAGVVEGGGFLIFDTDRSEYAGGLELAIAVSEELQIRVTALGLITTRMPDGSEGFSLLAILGVEFNPAFQIGMGFTWNGIGGLLGLNRTMRLEPMAEGIKSGALERIMFPRDIVANAARIISDLRAFFPPHQDTFLIGGMLKFGWGSPTLLSLSLGVVIQIPPGTFAILGVLKLALPDENAGVLQLNVGFMGAYEPDRERAWFYATLYDSRVLFITIEGGMGVLVAWGEDANFVISVGGFHPQFTPPPLPFPVPDRLAITILNEDMARIRVMGYFAVTSNTVQFGCRAELFFGFDAVNIEGHLALDALFQFSPFYFIVEISSSFSLRVFGMGLFCIRWKGTLEGPTPWRITGSASLSILFFSIEVDVDHTWGETVDTVLPGTAVMPLLEAELNKEANWKALPPARSRLHVSLRELEADTESLVLHPMGELVVSQRTVPLGLEIQKVGSQAATDANQFRLESAGAGLARRGEHRERFAMAQFQELGDTAKLARPAFEREPGGIRLGVDGRSLGSSRMVKRRVRYETVIMDTGFERFVRPFFQFWNRLFDHFLGGAAVTRIELSAKHRRQMEPFGDGIVVDTPAFTVANLDDNRPVEAAAARFATEADAREFMRRRVAVEPALAGQVHVIPTYEANVGT